MKKWILSMVLFPLVVGQCAADPMPLSNSARQNVKTSIDLIEKMGDKATAKKLRKMLAEGKIVMDDLDDANAETEHTGEIVIDENYVGSAKTWVLSKKGESGSLVALAKTMCHERVHVEQDNSYKAFSTANDLVGDHPAELEAWSRGMQVLDDWALRYTSWGHSDIVSPSKKQKITNLQLANDAYQLLLEDIERFQESGYGKMKPPYPFKSMEEFKRVTRERLARVKAEYDELRGVEEQPPVEHYTPQKSAAPPQKTTPKKTKPSQANATPEKAEQPQICSAPPDNAQPQQAVTTSSEDWLLGRWELDNVGKIKAWGPHTGMVIEFRKEDTGVAGYIVNLNTMARDSGHYEGERIFWSGKTNNRDEPAPWRRTMTGVVSTGKNHQEREHSQLAIVQSQATGFIRVKNFWEYNWRKVAEVASKPEYDKLDPQTANNLLTVTLEEKVRILRNLKKLRETRAMAQSMANGPEKDRTMSQLDLFERQLTKRLADNQEMEEVLRKAVYSQ